MKASNVLINDLIDEHGESFTKCKGCLICDQIASIRKEQLERDSTIRFSHILAKGQDMTRSDIEFLIENEVTRKKIANAVGMSECNFNRMLGDLGLKKFSRQEKGETDEMARLDLTVPEYVQLFYVEKKSVGEIADLKGVKPSAISSWKSYNKDKINKYLNKSPETPKKYEEPKKVEAPKMDPASELRQMVNDLSDEVNKLRDIEKKLLEENESLKQKVSERDYLNAACEDTENEVSELQREIDELILENSHLKSLLKMYL